MEILDPSKEEGLDAWSRQSIQARCLETPSRLASPSHPSCLASAGKVPASHCVALSAAVLPPSAARGGALTGLVSRFCQPLESLLGQALTGGLLTLARLRLAPQHTNIRQTSVASLHLPDSRASANHCAIRFLDFPKYPRLAFLPLHSAACSSCRLRSGWMLDLCSSGVLSTYEHERVAVMRLPSSSRP